MLLDDDIEEFRGICRAIVGQGKTKGDLQATESSDEFQTAHFCGGYETLEDAYCFSYYSRDEGEQWFQITLQEASEIALGSAFKLSLRAPD